MHRTLRRLTWSRLDFYPSRQSLCPGTGKCGQAGLVSLGRGTAAARVPDNRAHRTRPARRVAGRRGPVGAERQGHRAIECRPDRISLPARRIRAASCPGCGCERPVQSGVGQRRPCGWLGRAPRGRRQLLRRPCQCLGGQRQPLPRRQGQTAADQGHRGQSLVRRVAHAGRAGAGTASIGVVRRQCLVYRRGHDVHRAGQSRALDKGRSATRFDRLEVEPLQ